MADIVPSLRRLTDRELGVLHHALGLDAYGRGQMYRNHFVTGEASDDHPDCMALVDMGLMTRRPGSPLTGGDALFTVTGAGKAAALAQSPPAPKPTRSQARYARYLRISDVTGMSFRQFLAYEEEGLRA